MKLDSRLWDALQAHGISESHLDMLLRLLDLHKSGALTWHVAHGQLTQIDLRLVSSPRPHDAACASETLLGGESVVR